MWLVGVYSAIYCRLYTAPTKLGVVFTIKSQGENYFWSAQGKFLHQQHFLSAGLAKRKQKFTMSPWLNCKFVCHVVFSLAKYFPSFTTRIKSRQARVIHQRRRFQQTFFCLLLEVSDANSLCLSLKMPIRKKSL